MKGLAIADNFELPIEYVTSTGGILAKKGAGKSNAAVVIAEKMYAAGVPWVAIDPKGDWYGIRSSADGTGPGLPIVVFGGRHGDVPLEPTAGALLADLVLAQRITCVLDVSEFSKADTRRFLLAFAERLYRQADAEPLHLFLEEAHEYLPQMVRSDDAQLVGAFQKIVKQGRFKGLGCTIISQRSAAVNKDVLTQVDTLIVMRTTSPQDRKAVDAWIDVHADSDEALKTLPSLAAGEAWVWAPEWNLLERIQFRRRSTFDSGATPMIGEKRKPPATLADVDLVAIKELMAETIEKAKADDPAELRKTIVKLQRELHQAQQPPTKPVEPLEVPVPFVPDDVADALAFIAAGAEDIPDWQTFTYEIATAVNRAVAFHWHAKERAAEALKALEAGDDDRRQHIPRSRKTGDGAGAVAHTPRPDRTPQRSDPPPRREPRSAPVPRPEADVVVKAGALRILQSLASLHPDRLTESQIGTLAKLRKGGTRDTYMSALRRNGFIVKGGDGRYNISDAGFAYLGGDIPQPATAEELLVMWRDKLKAGARRMLDLLVEAYPDGMFRETLGAAVDLESSGGTFGTYLSTLRRNGLIEETNGEVRASPTLFQR